MEPHLRVATWSLSMVGFTVIQAAYSGAGFLGQPVTLPLWAVLLFILLPGEAFADVGRTAVKRFDQYVEKREPGDGSGS